MRVVKKLTNVKVWIKDNPKLTSNNALIAGNGQITFYSDNVITIELINTAIIVQSTRHFHHLCFSSKEYSGEMHCISADQRTKTATYKIDNLKEVDVNKEFINKYSYEASLGLSKLLKDIGYNSSQNLNDINQWLIKNHDVYAQVNDLPKYSIIDVKHDKSKEIESTLYEIPTDFQGTILNDGLLHLVCCLKRKENPV